MIARRPHTAALDAPAPRDVNADERARDRKIFSRKADRPILKCFQNRLDLTEQFVDLVREFVCGGIMAFELLVFRLSAA
ncbi:MAG: hypothetical protein AAGB11_15675 [Pseudomonadota bacterium]